MEFNSSSRGVGSSGPRATPQVGSVALRVEGRQTPATTCARDDPTAGPLAPAASHWSEGQCTRSSVLAGDRSPWRGQCATRRVFKMRCESQDSRPKCLQSLSEWKRARHPWKGQETGPASARSDGQDSRRESCTKKRSPKESAGWPFSRQRPQLPGQIPFLR